MYDVQVVTPIGVNDLTYLTGLEGQMHCCKQLQQVVNNQQLSAGHDYSFTHRKPESGYSHNREK